MCVSNNAGISLIYDLDVGIYPGDRSSIIGFPPAVITNGAIYAAGGAGGNIILAGGAQAKNIFWQIGSSATIGDFTSFKGNVLALTSITMNSGAIAQGRMLAINGAVVLTSTNTINKP